MTSAPISDYQAIQAYRGSGNTDKAANQADELFGSFQDAMNQAKNSQPDTVKETAGKVQNVGSVTRTADAFAAKGETAKVQKNEGSQKTEQTTDPKQAQNVKDSVDKTAKDTEKEVISEIADELDVTEEEVAEAMEALGLTVMDLMDQGNMAALVTRLNGEADPMALLTDAEMFAVVKDLTDTVGEIVEQNLQDLSEELGMDMDEVLDMLQATMKTPENLETETNSGVLVEVENEMPLEEPEKEPGTVKGNGEEAGEENASVQTKESLTTEETAGQNKSMMNFHQESSPLVNQMYHPENITTDGIRQPELSFTSYVDTNDIINQIGEYVKIHQSEGLSEMEISLNPESLGNIHLQVASREGVITAVITTQNEAVREALMVQAMTLKEDLNQQGLKVEAVDVTVASHEFERNMENGGEEAKNLFEQQVQKQTRRRIVINNLKQAEELLSDEDLTEAEKIQIDMMAKSGNSVDFTA